VRTFVALIPPAGALAELADAVAPLHEAHPDLRWTPPTQWHLTLAFLGDVDEGRVPELTERLDRAAHRYPPLRLVLAGGGRFGDRVLWTRVLPAPADDRELSIPTRRVVRVGTPSRASKHGQSSQPAEGLRRLAASTAAAARRSGMGVDQRGYRPHITLARSRPGADLRPAVAQLAGFTGSPWTADALHLVRSRLGAGPGGTAAHDVVGTWRLAGKNQAETG
jgi:RNA 2',3'-cyclic 3'-phosphodiesterase